MEWYWTVLIIICSVVVWFVLSALLYKQFFKRFYDIVLSGLAIIVLFPLLIVLTIVGTIAMKGNPFFIQLRPGRINKKTGKEQIFKLIKFRTMSNAKDKDGNLLPDRVRLNKYGKILRKTSLDELPELFNIFIGNMSLIGPRPWLPKYLQYFNTWEHQRHKLRPGLTGLAQISGRNALSWKEKIEKDIEYVNNVSFFLDAKIFLLTIKKVFVRDGVEFTEGHQSIMEYFETHNNENLENGN